MAVIEPRPDAANAVSQDPHKHQNTIAKRISHPNTKMKSHTGIQAPGKGKTQKNTANTQRMKTCPKSATPKNAHITLHPPAQVNNPDPRDHSFKAHKLLMVVKENRRQKKGEENHDVPARILRRESPDMILLLFSVDMAGDAGLPGEPTPGDDAALLLAFLMIS